MRQKRARILRKFLEYDMKKERLRKRRYLRNTETGRIEIEGYDRRDYQDFKKEIKLRKFRSRI